MVPAISSVNSLARPLQTLRNLRGAGLTGLDQMVSSATNFLVLVVAGRWLGPRGLGIVSVCLAIAFGAILLERAAVGEPLLVRKTSDTSGALGLAWLLSVAASLLMLIAAFFVSPGLKAPLTILAIVVPALMLQDLGRYVTFRLRRPELALQSDAVWAIGLVAMLVVLATLPNKTPAMILEAWGTGAVLGATYLICTLAAKIRPGEALDWLRGSRGLSGWMSAQAVTSQLGVQAALVSVGAIAGLEALGSLRAAHALFGPLLMAFTGIGVFAMPRLGSAARIDRSTLDREVRRYILVCAVAGIGFGIALTMGRYILIPLAFGGGFGQSLPLVLPLAIGWAILGIASPFGYALRALGEGRSVFLVQATGTGMGFALTAALAYRWGALGGAWGAFGQQTTLAVAAYLLYRRGLRRAGGPRPAPEDQGAAGDLVL